MIHPLAGRPSPLGAAWDGEGTNFALASAHATAVDLCLFAASDEAMASDQIELRPDAAGVWQDRKSVV